MNFREVVGRSGNDRITKKIYAYNNHSYNNSLSKKLSMNKGEVLEAPSESIKLVSGIVFG
jgi:hypothetical protein